jgi:hypothetical protein
MGRLGPWSGDRICTVFAAAPEKNRGLWAVDRSPPAEWDRRRKFERPVGGASNADIVCE